MICARSSFEKILDRTSEAFGQMVQGIAGGVAEFQFPLFVCARLDNYI